MIDSKLPLGEHLFLSQFLSTEIEQIYMENQLEEERWQC